MTYVGSKPANKPVNQTDIEDDAISLAKLAGGTDGNIISYDASGNPVAIATGNDGQVLTSTGAGSPPAFEAASSTTINNNADNRVITGSGTANTLEGESTLTYDGTNLDLADSKKLRLGTGNDLEIYHDGSNSYLKDTGSGSFVGNASAYYLRDASDTSNTGLCIANSGTRIGIGIDSPDDVRLHVKTPNQACIQTERTGTGNSGHLSFKNPNGQVGEIVTNNSATSYLTSSDYRLKENIDYNFDATTRLKQLKPARFNFKANTDTTVDGFIAHEVSSIVPEAISGTKDATETRQKVVLDFNGNFIARNIEQTDWTKGKADKIYPSNSTWEASKVYAVHQGIDQSKLVPLLVKTVLELEARIKTLEDA